MVQENWLTVEQVAQKLQVSSWTVRDWLRIGRIKGSRVGGRRVGWRIPESELGRILEKGMNAPEVAE